MPSVTSQPPFSVQVFGPQDVYVSPDAQDVYGSPDALDDNRGYPTGGGYYARYYQ